jgi:hypothetical protein
VLTSILFLYLQELTVNGCQKIRKVSTILNIQSTNDYPPALEEVKRLAVNQNVIHISDCNMPNIISVHKLLRELRRGEANSGWAVLLQNCHTLNYLQS